MGKVLVVEDDPVVMKFITRLMDNLGHRYYQARTSTEAIAFLESEQVDLVLLDIMLAGATSGLRVLVHYHHLHQAKKITDIPIFIMSALPERELMGIAQAYPFVKKYYLKPFDLESLVSEMKKYLPDTITSP